MKATREVTQALTNLRASTDFQVFLSWLLEDEVAETERCIAAEGTVLFRAQGAARKLKDIREEYLKAPDTLKKFQQQR